MSTLKKFLVKIGLKGLTATQKVDKGRNHVVMITDNTNYPELQAGLPEISTACDKLEESILEVQFNGGRIAYNRKSDREKELDELITLLGERVQVLSFGDKSKILSAGFQTRKEASPITSIGIPQDLRAKTSSFAGTIDLRWNVVHGARYYQVMMTAGDPNLAEGWQMVGVSGQTKHTVDNLETGKFYSFRVNAVGNRTESAYSDFAHSIAA